MTRRLRLTGPEITVNPDRLREIRLTAIAARFGDLGDPPAASVDCVRLRDGAWAPVSRVRPGEVAVRKVGPC